MNNKRWKRSRYRRGVLKVYRELITVPAQHSGLSDLSPQQGSRIGRRSAGSKQRVSPALSGPGLPPPGSSAVSLSLPQGATRLRASSHPVWAPVSQPPPRAHSDPKSLENGKNPVPQSRSARGRCARLTSPAAAAARGVDYLKCKNIVGQLAE